MALLPFDPSSVPSRRRLQRSATTHTTPPATALAPKRSAVWMSSLDTRIRRLPVQIPARESSRRSAKYELNGTQHAGNASRKAVTGRIESDWRDGKDHHHRTDSAATYGPITRQTITVRVTAHSSDYVAGPPNHVAIPPALVPHHHVRCRDLASKTTPSTTTAHQLDVRSPERQPSTITARNRNKE